MCLCTDMFEFHSQSSQNTNADYAIVQQYTSGSEYSYEEILFSL